MAHPPAHIAARMRQLLFDNTMVPSEAGVDLAWLVVSTRPWTDEDAIAKALREWAAEHWGEESLDPGLADGAGQVAEHMHALGNEHLDDGAMVFITFQMLGNVAKGRSPTDQDLLRDHVSGFPERTLRRYRQRAREQGKDPDVESFHTFMRSLQYDLDVAALVRAGRKPAAARRWLKRKP